MLIIRIEKMNAGIFWYIILKIELVIDILTMIETTKKCTDIEQEYIK